MAVITDIANAVTDRLNGAVFSQGFTAAMSFRPQYRLKELGTLKVTVVPKGSVRTLESRSAERKDHEVDIGILRRVADDAEIQALLDLVEEIEEHFREDRSLAGVPGAACMEIGNDPIYDPEHLDKYRQFTSVVTLTYRLIS